MLSNRQITNIQKRGWREGSHSHKEGKKEQSQSQTLPDGGAIVVLTGEKYCSYQCEWGRSLTQLFISALSSDCVFFTEASVMLEEQSHFLARSCGISSTQIHFLVP